MTIVKINQIKDGFGLRSGIDEDAMKELMNSISEHGVIVPVKVRQLDDAHYEIIYGHRRVEACRRLDIKELDVIIEGLDDTETRLQALTENIQRKDLSDMEEGEAFKAVKEVTGWSDERIGKAVGKSQQYINQRLALTQAGDIKDAFTTRVVIPDAAHKAISIRQIEKSSPDLVKPIAEKVVKEGLTSRQTENLVNEVKRTINIGGEKLAREIIRNPYEEISRTVTEDKWDEPVKPQHKAISPDEQFRVSFFRGEEFNDQLIDFKRLSTFVEFVVKNYFKNPGNALATLNYLRNVVINLLDKIDTSIYSLNKGKEDALAKWEIMGKEETDVSTRKDPIQ